MTSSSLPLHGPKRGQSKAGWLYKLLRFCVKQHMPLIFCQPTAVADGTLHAQCPGAKQVPLAINATRKCFSAPGWLTAHCCVLWQAATTHLYWLIYPTEGTKLLVWASAHPVLHRHCRHDRAASSGQVTAVNQLQQPGPQQVLLQTEGISAPQWHFLMEMSLEATQHPSMSFWSRVMVNSVQKHLHKAVRDPKSGRASAEYSQKSLFAPRQLPGGVFAYCPQQSGDWNRVWECGISPQQKG